MNATRPYRRRCLSRAIVLSAAFVLIAGLTGCPIVIDLSGVNPSDFPIGGDSTGDDTMDNLPGDVAGVSMSEMERLAHDLVNAERAGEDLPALAARDDLVAIARAHSEDMIRRDFFSHTNPDGEDPFDRMREADVAYNIAGENIAWNNYSNPAETAVEGWMESSGHRENILRPSFTHTGMGVATDGNGAYFYSQVFIGVSKGVPVEEIHVFYFEE